VAARAGETFQRRMAMLPATRSLRVSPRTSPRHSQKNTGRAKGKTTGSWAQAKRSAP